MEIVLVILTSSDKFKSMSKKPPLDRRVTFSVSIPKSLLKAARLAAFKSDVSFSTFVTQLLRREIEGASK